MKLHEYQGKDLLARYRVPVQGYAWIFFVDSKGRLVRVEDSLKKYRILLEEEQKEEVTEVKKVEPKVKEDNK